MRSSFFTRIAPVVVAAGVVVGGAGVAGAAPTIVSEATSGWVAVPDNTSTTIDDSPTSGGVGTLATKKVGGGTWSYGSGSDWLYKSCWSNYKHNTKYHSSSAVIGSATHTDYANAKKWSKARATAGYAHTCYAYWNNNP